jgi:hypothetical protein
MQGFPNGGPRPKNVITEFSRQKFFQLQVGREEKSLGTYVLMRLSHRFKRGILSYLFCFFLHFILLFL